MWQVNNQSINSVCTSWNKGVRRILNRPHDAHTWLLDVLLKQNHIKNQFIIRTSCSLFCMLKSHNIIMLFIMLILQWDPVCPCCVLKMVLISNHIVKHIVLKT